MYVWSTVFFVFPFYQGFYRILAYFPEWQRHFRYILEKWNLFFVFLEFFFFASQKYKYCVFIKYCNYYFPMWKYREEHALLFDFHAWFSYYARVILAGFSCQMFFNIIFSSLGFGHSWYHCMRRGRRWVLRINALSIKIFLFAVTPHC